MVQEVFGTAKNMSKNAEKDREEKLSPVIRTYKVRWFILVIFVIYNALSNLQWIQYSIIANLVSKYYGISITTVDWTSVVFMAPWPTLMFPAAFIIDRMGLRVAALIGSCLTALGALVKVLSIDPDLFYVVMIGQALTAISLIFILTLPPKIAVTWFPSEEASRVCALGVFGMTLGTALGFLVPPMIVKDHDNINDIGSDLNIMCISLAAFCLPIAIIVLIYFPKEPPHPPSLMQYKARENHKTMGLAVFLTSVGLLLKNKALLIHMVSFACNIGIYTAFTTLLNPIVLSYFEGAQEDAGIMGMVMILSGTMSNILIGIILDKTRKFKESAIILFIACILTMAGFVIALEMRSKWLCYFSISAFGLALNAYLPVGYELGIELTYPSPESTVNGILLASAQLLSIPLTTALSEINSSYGAFYTVLAQCGVLLVGTVTTCLTPNILNRQQAFKLGIATTDVTL